MKKLRLLLSFLLALMLMTGSSWAFMSEDARMLEQLAEQGSPEYQTAIGLLYLMEEEAVEYNPDKAFYWLKKGAEAGVPMGQFGLGQCCYDGYGVQQDAGKAVY